jgi:hypothetical protein
VYRISGIEIIQISNKLPILPLFVKDVRVEVGACHMDQHQERHQVKWQRLCVRILDHEVIQLLDKKFNKYPPVVTFGREKGPEYLELKMFTLVILSNNPTNM